MENSKDLVYQTIVKNEIFEKNQRGVQNLQPAGLDRVNVSTRRNISEYCVRSILSYAAAAWFPNENELRSLTSAGTSY